MYLLYEHHKDSSGAIVATDMLLTSRYPGAPYVNFKNALEKAIFEFCKFTFKEVHIKDRTIDMDTYIWSFFGAAGEQVYQKLKASPIASAGLLFQRVDNLADQRKANHITPPAASTIDPADFFYQQAAPIPTEMPLIEVEKKLAHLLDIDALDLSRTPAKDLKRLYRSAAMSLHPDRNNGDSKGMTELNWLWQTYQKLTGVTV